jgi:hypothetical protein
MNIVYPILFQPLKTPILKRVSMDPLGPSYKLPDEETPQRKTLVSNQPTPAAEREPGDSSGVSKTKQIPIFPMCSASLLSTPECLTQDWVVSFHPW